LNKIWENQLPNTKIKLCLAGLGVKDFKAKIEKAGFVEQNQLFVKEIKWEIEPFKRILIQ